MSPIDRRALYVLTGPTASGKTEVGVELARRLGAEVVSADSMAVYRGMDIGTAKPSARQRARVPHHLIDVADPAETFSVARFVEMAWAVIGDIRSRGRLPLVVGGTPLYIRSLLSGLFDIPSPDPTLRRRLRTLAEAGEEGRARLYSRLRRVDPAAARRLHPNDVKRVVRALEVYETAGRPISRLQTQWSEPPRRACGTVIITRSVDDLRARVSRRVRDMFHAGLVNEVEGLLRRPGGLGPTARAAVGYREVAEYLEQGGRFEDVTKRIEKRTWRVARKQLTWLRRFTAAARLTMGPEDSPENVAKVLYKSLMKWHNLGPRIRQEVGTG